MEGKGEAVLVPGGAMRDWNHSGYDVLMEVMPRASLTSSITLYVSGEKVESEGGREGEIGRGRTIKERERGGGRKNERHAKRTEK